jgi:hypothetical protein
MEAMCFFCEGQIEGKAYHEGKGIDGQDVAIGICPDCAPQLGRLLADVAEELEPGLHKGRWLQQVLERLSAEAWETLALNVESKEAVGALVC